MSTLTISRVFGPWDMTNAINYVPVAKNRKAMAEVYADAIRGDVGRGAVWGDLNRAILKRWSPSGLNYIKTKAHEMLKSGASTQEGK